MHYVPPNGAPPYTTDAPPSYWTCANTPNPVSLYEELKPEDVPPPYDSIDISFPSGATNTPLAMSSRACPASVAGAADLTGRPPPYIETANLAGGRNPSGHVPMSSSGSTGYDNIAGHTISNDEITVNNDLDTSSTAMVTTV